ncbi:MAG: FkbM family methyltransferase [Afipia sp.]
MSAQLLARFNRELDEIEKTVPMTGNFARVDPYIVKHDQFGHTFWMIIFHAETVSWYDNKNTDWSLMRLRDHSWLAEGDIIFDLGCNAGFNSTWYAIEAGPTGHVHAFDPYPWNTLSAQYNAELNGLKNVTTYTVGISDKEGTLPISITDARIFNGAPTQKFNASLKPITDYASLNPTFMKIDIEGAEVELSRSDFSRFPNLNKIYLELHEPFIRERNLDPRECLTSFCRFGFDVHLEEPTGRLWTEDFQGDAGGQLYLTRRK